MDRSEYVNPGILSVFGFHTSLLDHGVAERPNSTAWSWEVTRLGFHKEMASIADRPSAKRIIGRKVRNSMPAAWPYRSPLV
ncbi:hypothetical protein ABIB82_007830 [Bradyrhizobium sp. i1.8.4]